MTNEMKRAKEQLAEHREYLVSRGFHILDVCATRITEEGSEAMHLAGDWRPFRTLFPNDYAWRSPVGFATPVEAYVYAELHSWGRV